MQEKKRRGQQTAAAEQGVKSVLRKEQLGVAQAEGSGNREK
jgi:hypothetical protein